MVYKEARPSYTNHLSTIMENTVLAVLLLTVAVVTAADGSYQPPPVGAEITMVSNHTGASSNGLNQVCLETKLNTAKKLLASITVDCNEGDYNSVIDNACFMMSCPSRCLQGLQGCLH